MLRLLRIRNFAIIDELELEFDSGFNSITGETGAGKSIILDAVGLILGNRANADVLRAGSDEATVEALFDVGRNEAFEKKLHAHGLDMNRADHEVIVKRTVHRNGKNKIFFNGELITLAQLADICENLVDLCSQHEHQSLAKSNYQLDLIDRYGGLLDKRREVRELFSALRSCEAELNAQSKNDREQARTEDFLRFQINEIDEFAPQDGEEETLLGERRRLLNATQLMDSANQAMQLLEGADHNSDVQTLLGRASQKLAKAFQLDQDLKPAVEAIERAALEVQDAVAQLSSYASGLELDPTRLEQVEERLVRWSEIRKKYGNTSNEVLDARTKIEQELNEYAHRQEKITAIKLNISALKTDYQKTAKELSKKRKAIARTLQESIQRELTELMMAGTRFEIEFSELANESSTADGIDRIQFLFSPNPGEGLKPVAKIASGGELSRVMLAIRRTISDRGGIGVYLFDEIDAGIGGQTASIVGKKLQSVSKHNQIIVITHLPQVAAYANAHFSVSKKVASGRTTSQISLLEGTKRVEELARMLGGLNVTEKSRAHAKDLMKQASI